MAMNLDPAVMAFMQGLTPADVSNGFIDRVEAHWDEHGWGLWAIEVPGVAPFVGFTGLWPATHVLGYESREVGWRLARAHWGHGYATEAAHEALRFGFRTSASTRSCRSPCPRTSARGRSWSASGSRTSRAATSTTRASTRSRIRSSSDTCAIGSTGRPGSRVRPPDKSQ